VDGLVDGQPGPAFGVRQPLREAVPAASLVVIAQDGTPGRHYPLAGATTEIGREAGDIVLGKDPYVCPRHARVTFRNRGFLIEDLGSVNGVYVRLGSAPSELRNGDLLLMGLAVLRFEVVEETESRTAPAVRGSTRVFGTPTVPRRARLVVQTTEDQARDIFYISRAETIIGREAGDIVFTDDPFMSRRHAALRRSAASNTYTLRDLGSSNGTFIAIRSQQPLSHGDFVRIGQHLFRLDVHGGGPS
jgi:pSer/pThr/pTyr-binding forkhead associated (FHA) protein